jgi:2-keto-4-pentenoate hydratase
VSPEHIAEAAHLLLEARRQRERLADLPAHCRPVNAHEAETICEAMAAGFERPIGGWKVGCTDPASPAKLGLTRPFCGQIPAHLIYASRATVSHADIMRPVVEAEIAFRLARDLPPRKGHYSRAEVADAVQSLHPGIEIPESRLEDDHRLGALGMVADQGYAGRYVAGALWNCPRSQCGC